MHPPKTLLPTHLPILALQHAQEPGRNPHRLQPCRKPSRLRPRGPRQAQLSSLRIPVFRLVRGGVRKKPFCGREILAWFRERGVVARAAEIAVVGDRLGTDVLMAADMGAWSVWCSEGVFGGDEARRRRNILERVEVCVERYLRVNKGMTAPAPRGWHSV